MGKDLIEELKNDTMLETLNRVDSILEEGKDIIDDVLDDEDATITERIMAQHFVEEYLDMVHDMISEDFGVTRHLVEIDGDCEDCEFKDECEDYEQEEDSEEESDECDGDCEHCEFGDSAPFSFHRAFFHID